MLCSKCKGSFDTLAEHGLCQNCHVQSEARRSDLVELARQQCEGQGLVLVDDDAQVSEGEDNGCYVAAWVFVDFEGTRFDKEGGENGKTK